MKKVRKLAKQCFRLDEFDQEDLNLKSLDEEDEEMVEMIETELKQNGLALKFVRWEMFESNRSEIEMRRLKQRFYRIAIHENPYAMKYVTETDLSEELCLEAIKVDPQGYWDDDYMDPISVIANRIKLTPRMAYEGVRQSGTRLLYVPIKLQSPRVLLEAIKQDHEMLTNSDTLDLLDMRTKDEVFLEIAMNRNDLLQQEPFGKHLKKEFKQIVNGGPVYKPNRPIDQSFQQLDTKLLKLMHHYMFSVSKTDGVPYFSIFINDVYQRKSLSSTIEQEPHVLRLMPNQFKSYRLCRYSIRLESNRKNSDLEELKKYSPYHVLENLN